jgi:hypothetical protein
MKLPKLELDTETKLREFDVWITPSLGEIKDTTKFKTELAGIAETFEIMGRATGNFADPDHCTPAAISDAFIKHACGSGFTEAAAVLDRLAAVLFLVTGKSDNNAKCQIPLYLRDQVKLPSFPTVKRSRNKDPVVISIGESTIPRVLSSDKYMEVVAALKDAPQRQAVFLNHYIAFLLSDPAYVSQLWSVGHSYFRLKSFGKERDFLSPLVAFKVRGSVAATGGHDPEVLLRKRLIEWGLQPEVDFNPTDVTLASLKKILGKSDKPRKKGVPPRKKSKSRAYDFILPFKTPGSFRRLCVQSQFYAGDSGSVSHKNVDQTATSRNALRAIVSDAVLIEYVDGAGYFSSLNGDLEQLLEMDGTEFCQIRSAPIRLRRELQHAGFLMPLELQQATYQTNNPTRKNVAKLLKKDGYGEAEISRSLTDCLERGLIIESEGKFQPSAPDRDKIRRYVLLDVAAIAGRSAESEMEEMRGALMVPGYGPFHGIKLDELVQQAKRLAPGLANEIDKSEVLMGDLRWLNEERIAIS